jgi:hypothetical protein
MEKIYILKKKKLMYGPYSLDYIKEKGIKINDLVWYDGLKDWISPSEVDFLQPFLSNEISTDNNKKNLLQKVIGFLK